MQANLSTTASSGIPAGVKQADDMTPEAWTGLIGGLMEFLGEEAKEPEHAADDDRPGVKHDPASGRFVGKSGRNYTAEELKKDFRTVHTGPNESKGHWHPDVGNFTMDQEAAQPHGAGIAFVTPEMKALFVKRSSDGDHPGEWAFPGGGIEAGENAVAAARREGAEETGHPTDGRLHPIDRRSTGGVDFVTFAHPVEEEFEPKLNGEHTEHAWAPLDAPPSPLHPGVAATLKKDGDGTDSMPIQNGKKSPFDPGTGPEVNLDDEQRDADGKFSSGAGRSDTEVGLTRREREDWGGRSGNRGRGGEGGSGWSASELADYGDKALDAAEVEKRTKQFVVDMGREPSEEERKRIAEGAILKPRGAKDAAREAEHTATIKFNGDFDMAGLLKHLHHLGAIGASRGVDAIDADDKPVRFGWDGDGADKIVQAEIDGKDILAADAWTVLGDIATDWALKLALDRESVRTIDQDGKLHIEVANICKANVCPYKGDEIPGWEDLGLDPDKIYKLLRDPEELENPKTLASANSLQVLKRHVPVNADDHQPWETVGATGSTATWSMPCIQNSLVVWAKDAIDDIESEAKRELSPGYHYKPDMTAGSYQGEHYDGVMREIRFNHLALVETGRQGSDVVIGDTDEVLWAIAERAIMEYLQTP